MPRPAAFIEQRTGEAVEVCFEAPNENQRPLQYRKMIDALGFIPQTATDAFRLFPELFPSAKAARIALEAWGVDREQGETLVRYKPQGNGQRWRTGIVGKGLDPQEWLESLFSGPVACEAKCWKAVICHHKMQTPVRPQMWAK